MIDVDHFKKVNDTYGHQSGDKVLSAIGAAILDEIRSSDFAARYGGEDIPLLSRIISVVDAYHSMTSVTPYRRKMTPEEAIEELKDKAGTQFDSHIVDVFVECLKKDRFPV